MVNVAFGCPLMMILKAAAAMNLLSNYLNYFLENDKVGNKKNL